MPARVVLQKTSAFTSAEIAGFQAPTDERDLDELDMSWITNSEGARLFRPGSAPPLRGTMRTLDQHETALYRDGSVEFYSRTRACASRSRSAPDPSRAAGAIVIAPGKSSP
jgi:hypothetical protein